MPDKDSRAIGDMLSSLHRKDFSAETGTAPVDAEVEDLLRPVWPDCEKGISGAMLMHKDDKAALELTFKAYGVSVPVTSPSCDYDTVAWAYDVLVLGVGRHVSKYQREPGEEGFIGLAKFRNWPQDWIDYVVAVGDRDETKAAKLAKKLDPLNKDCQPPRGMNLRDRSDG